MAKLNRTTAYSEKTRRGGWGQMLVGDLVRDQPCGRHDLAHVTFVIQCSDEQEGLRFPRKIIRPGAERLLQPVGHR